jgi:hypothetical protein
MPAPGTTDASAPRSRRVRAGTAALAWAVVVVVSTLVGLTAVGAIGSGIVGARQEPLSAAEVDAALASGANAPAPLATPAPSNAPSQPTGTGVIASQGGTVIARCTAGAVTVVSATPAQGYQLHNQSGEDPGRVRFESDRGRVEIRLSCRDGSPVGDVKIN